MNIHIDSATASVVTFLIVQLFTLINSRLQHMDQMRATELAAQASNAAAQASGRAETAANHLNEKIVVAQLAANAAQTTADSKEDKTRDPASRTREDDAPHIIIG